MPRWWNLGGIFGPLQFGAVVLLCTALHPGYDSLRQFVSELGAAGAPYAGLMNVAGFMGAALWLALFVVALGSRVRGTLAAGLGIALLAVFAAAMFASGVYSCDAGCWPETPTRDQRLHDLAAMVGFPSLILSSFALGLDFRRRDGWFDLARRAFAAGGLATAFFVAMIASVPGRTGTGLLQRLLLATLFLWLASVAWHLWHLEGASPRPAAPKGSPLGPSSD